MSPENPEIANTAKKTQRGAGFASVTPVVEGDVVELMGRSTCRIAAEIMSDRIGTEWTHFSVRDGRPGSRAAARVATDPG